LREIGKLGVKLANFLTDDPWNRRNSAGFFWTALREYDLVCTPRLANIADLKNHGCRRVEYLPFGYNPNCHFPQLSSNANEEKWFSAEVAIIGGADDDRLPFARACVKAGFKLATYGGYWDRVADLRPFHKGFAYGAALRKAVSGAAVSVCLVRRANRDGHSMRSYELPAMRAIVLAELTDDHCEIFGREGDCALFFKDATEMVNKAKWLISHQTQGREMAARAHARLTAGANTYRDRLHTIVATYSS
jgi:hypothetical protein